MLKRIRTWPNLLRTAGLYMQRIYLKQTTVLFKLALIVSWVEMPVRDVAITGTGTPFIATLSATPDEPSTCLV